jgi:high frequency lysogenization protein
LERGKEQRLDRNLEQVLALAGLTQCAYMVRQVARQGMVPNSHFGTAVKSLFVTSPRSSLEVFGTLDKLRTGLQTLQELLEGSRSILAQDDVLRYMMGILYLQSLLMKRKDLLNRVSEGLEAINRLNLDPPYAENEQVIRQLAKLYQDTLSTLPYRIQVKGEAKQLQNELLAAKIRVLLFAGVRAAVLWQQCGGKRWHLLLSRGRIRRDCGRLLQGEF